MTKTTLHTMWRALQAPGARQLQAVLMVAALGLAAVGGYQVVRAQSVASSLPTVSLAAEPLYARGYRAKPTLMLDLSVEFPTVGAAYRTATYDNAQEYLGYFDPDGCYTYNNGATELERYYTRSSTATNHGCGGTGFSGNFMNWATTSSIDVLRYALTGGDRIVDDADKTVLQRAVIRKAFWNNGSYFPSKSIASAAAVNYLPAVITGATAGNIHINNCLNRVHFGSTAPTGATSCDAPGASSDLGVTKPPALNPTFVFCVNEGNVNQNCGVAGNKLVAFGVGSTWTFAEKNGNFRCRAADFAGVDPAPGLAKTCRWRADVAETNRIDPAVPGMSADNFFYARAQVCALAADGKTALEGDENNAASYNAQDGRRLRLCKLYPRATPDVSYFKPVGNLQKYADRVRVGVFGYLSDNTSPPQRHGGVLRAPVKYVGHTAFDAGFNQVAGSNPSAEWDALTGVLVANPLNATEGVSGVINYVNRFGRTGNFGEYKSYDPMGELYYESIRYLQGLQPTPAAVANVTAAHADGFPVYSEWTDPHPADTGLAEYSCVKNSVVVMGDIFTHQDRTIPGAGIDNTQDDIHPSAVNAAQGIMDSSAWAKVVGGFESGNSVTYTDGSGVSRTTSNPNATLNAARWGMETQGTGASGSSGYYWSGIAYWANTHDFRPTTMSGDKGRAGMRVSTYSIDVNENSASFTDATRRNSAMYLAAKYGGFDDLSPGKRGNPFLGSDGASNANRSWESASVAGDAKNFFLASNASKLIAALDEIFAKVTTEAGSIAGGASSTRNLTQGDGYIYMAKFDSTNWSGDVRSFKVSVDADGKTHVAAQDEATWSAAAKLDALASTNSRKIYIGAHAGGATTATALIWDDLSSEQKDALGAVTVAGVDSVDATLGQRRLDWLRGDRSQEGAGAGLRPRSSRLGDIVNSGVVYAGEPFRGINDAGYATWYAANKSRTKALYVGSNDGMLHAFNATNGEELFAYLPSSLLGKLVKLTTPGYVHQSYVDATPTVAEAKVGSNWASVLVGGLGGGAQGVYALDVSNPSAFDEDKVLWEFTDADDASLGNVVGKPQVMKFNIGGSTKWFAVIPSGVNNNLADGHASTTAKPALFFLDLSKPAGTAWAQGSNYFKLELPLGSGITDMASGVINVAATGDESRAVKEMYAGDLHGNLWKLNFAGKTTADWQDMAKMSALKDTGNNPEPLFVAKSGTSASAKPQPISAEPYVAVGPARTSIVMFGTGKYLEQNDNSSPFDTQSVYAVWDNGQKAVAGRGRLAVASTNTTDGTIATPDFVWGHPASDTDMTSRSGWVFDLPYSSTGERQVSGYAGVGRKVIFGTIEPAASGCAEGGGRVYAVNLLNGDGSFIASTIGIQGQPFIMTSKVDVSDTDSTGREWRKTSRSIVFQGEEGLKTEEGTELLPTSGGFQGRVSWRHIANYDELRRK